MPGRNNPKKSIENVKTLSTAINPAILRQLWIVIEETQTQTLLHLNDADLIQQLLRQLMLRQSLTLAEFNTVIQYLRSRTSLIRDVAQACIA